MGEDGTAFLGMPNGMTGSGIVVSADWRCNQLPSDGFAVNYRTHTPHRKGLYINIIDSLIQFPVNIGAKTFRFHSCTCRGPICALAVIMPLFS
jgi:hypothetical protein